MIAGVIVVIPLYCVAVLMSFLSARLGTTAIYGQSSGVYDHYFNTFLYPIDLIWSFVLAVAMAIVIMLVHTYYGFTASGGPAGVGEAVGARCAVAGHRGAGDHVHLAGHLRPVRATSTCRASTWTHRHVSPHHSRLGGQLILIAAIVVFVLVCSALFAGTLTRSVPVTLTSDRSGLVMESGAKVKLRGVEVGRVAGIESAARDPVSSEARALPGSDQPHSRPTSQARSVRPPSSAPSMST